MKSRFVSLTVILFFILASIASTTPKTAPLTNISNQTPAAALSGKIIYDEESSLQQGTLVKTDIMTIDIATKAVANLTDNKDLNASFCCPSGSLDGSKIVYCVGARLSDAQSNTEYWNSQLYVMDIDGKNPQKITVLPVVQGNSTIENFIQERYPAWSPDDAKIAFASNREALATTGKFDDELFVMDLATKTITQLTNAEGYSEVPTWSPDGKQIAFMSDRSGNWEIYTTNSDGTGTAAQLTNNTTSERFPSWSHDGKNLVYTSDRDGNLNLYIYNLEAKTETLLTNNPADDFTGRWSSDDQWVVFGSSREGAQKIFVINVATKEEIKITDNQANDRFQNWVPNPPIPNQASAASSGAPASSEGSNTTNSNPPAANSTTSNGSDSANSMCTQFNLTPEECANLGEHNYTYTAVATFNPKGCGQGPSEIKLNFVFSEGGKLTMQINGGELNYTRGTPNNYSGVNMIPQTNSKTEDKLVFNINGFSWNVILYTLKDGAHKCTWDFNYTLKN